MVGLIRLVRSLHLDGHFLQFRQYMMHLVLPYAGLLFVMVTEVQCTVYKFMTFPNGVLYEVAKRECDSLGYQLAVLKTAEQITNIESYLNSQNLVRDVWIGMYWDGDIRQFRWEGTNDLVTENVNWSSGEPNCMTPSTATCPSTSIFQNCVRLERVSYYLKTHNCERQYDILCQSKNTPTTETLLETTMHSTSEHLSTTEYEMTSNPSEETTVAIEETTTKVTTETTKTTTAEVVLETTDGTESSTTEIQTTHAYTTVFAEITSRNNTNTCVCSCALINFLNATTSVEELMSLLKVDRTKTSSYIRKRTSAPDGRFSSKVIGYSGGIFLTAILSLFVLFDCTNVATCGYKKCSNGFESISR